MFEDVPSWHWHRQRSIRTLNLFNESGETSQGFTWRMQRSLMLILYLKTIFLKVKSGQERQQRKTCSKGTATSLLIVACFSCRISNLGVLCNFLNISKMHFSHFKIFVDNKTFVCFVIYANIYSDIRQNCQLVPLSFHHQCHISSTLTDFHGGDHSNSPK